MARKIRGLLIAAVSQVTCRPGQGLPCDENFHLMAATRNCAMFKGLPSSRVWKQAARLNNIAGSSATAYRFDAKYTKIELLLIQKNVLIAAFGLRRFWRENLPTLKFHNDGISMFLTRIATQTKAEADACPAKIILHQANGTTQELDCRSKHSSDILKELVALTGAQAVPAEEIPLVRRGDDDA